MACVWKPWAAATGIWPPCSSSPLASPSLAKRAGPGAPPASSGDSGCCCCAASPPVAGRRSRAELASTSSNDAGVRSGCWDSTAVGTEPSIRSGVALGGAVAAALCCSGTRVSGDWLLAKRSQGLCVLLLRGHGSPACRRRGGLGGGATAQRGGGTGGAATDPATDPHAAGAAAPPANHEQSTPRACMPVPCAGVESRCPAPAPVLRARTTCMRTRGVRGGVHATACHLPVSRPASQLTRLAARARCRAGLCGCQALVALEARRRTSRRGGQRGWWRIGQLLHLDLLHL